MSEFAGMGTQNGVVAWRYVKVEGSPHKVFSFVHFGKQAELEIRLITFLLGAVFAKFVGRFSCPTYARRRGMFLKG